MEISSMGIQDLFGSNPKLPTTNKTKTYSDSKNMSTHGGRKKLAKIDEHDKKRNTLKDNMYFQSPARNTGGRSQHIANPHQISSHNHTPKNNQLQPVRRNPIGQSPTNNRLRSHNHSHHHHNGSHSY